MVPQVYTIGRSHLIAERLSARHLILQHVLGQCMYHKVREYFVYRDGHGLGSMAIHLAHHCFSFNMRWM